MPEEHSELKYLRRFFAKTVNDQEPLTPFTKNLCLPVMLD